MLDEAIPLLDFLWARETATRSPTVPQQRWALEQRYRVLAQRSGADAWAPVAQRFLQTIEGGAKEARRAVAAWSRRQVTQGVGSARLAAGIAMREGFVNGELVWAVVVHPEILDVIEEELAAVEIG